jgi:hypothetical protein
MGIVQDARRGASRWWYVADANANARPDAVHADARPDAVHADARPDAVHADADARPDAVHADANASNSRARKVQGSGG